MKLKEFIETFFEPKFNLTPFQEKLIEFIEKDEGTRRAVVLEGYKQYKRVSNDYLTCVKLQNFKKGQRFALASLDGVKIFELTEIIPYGETEDETRTT
jgi:hypothetical protein